MRREFYKLNKLRGRGLDELRVRGGQALQALAERCGWSSLAKIPDDGALLELFQAEPGISSAEDLLDYFKTRTQPNALAALIQKEATIKELRHRWPRAEDEIISRADRIVAGKFNLLGLRDLYFGDPIDWHYEPLSGKRAPLTHWSQIDELDAVTVGDKKIVWELNRHQYFIDLGQAYWLSGEEEYAQTFVSHLNSWMDANPPKLGINWFSSLEIAFRSIAWLWAFGFFKDSPSLSPSTFLRALKFLYLNARHIEKNLSTYYSPNTHLTGEALALFYLGTFVPEFRLSRRWRETGKRILLQQLPIQVNHDGVYFEQTSYYHRYTVDFYMHFLILLRGSNDLVPRGLTEKLSSLLDHLMYITRPDGTTPYFGDDDGGFLLRLQQSEANDFTGTLSTGAALLGRADYKFVARDVAQETLWLVGADDLRAFDQLEEAEPSKTSVAFKDSGYFVMRDGWDRTANYLLFDCGPHGTQNCGHAHADALSFELVANGQTKLVDPGTFTYTGSNEQRNWFRGSLAHNTLSVDGESSSVPAGPFSWHSTARCELVKWISRERFDYVSGYHDGYMRLADPLEHTRSVLFLKRDYWIIRDQTNSKGEHRADLWFHFDYPLNPLIGGDSEYAFVRERRDNGGLDVCCFGKGHWREEKGSVSHCYAHKQPACVYAFSVQVIGNGEIITFLLPQTAQANWQISEVEAVGGLAFEVAHEKGLDLVMIRSAERVESARLSSDFEWSWTRFSNADHYSPSEFVLLNGKTLEIGQRPVLKSQVLLNFVVASHKRNQRQLPNELIFDCQVPIVDFESISQDVISQPNPS